VELSPALTLVCCTPAEHKIYYSKTARPKTVFIKESFMKFFFLLVLAINSVLCFGQAQALPVVGGTTAVKVTSAPTLTSAGVTIVGLGSTSISPGSDGIPIAYFPITGGNIDTSSFAGGIAHNSSGLRLSTSTGSIDLTNFLINTNTLSLSGKVSFGTTSLSGIPLFNLSFGTVPVYPFDLKLTATAAGALSTVLGVPNLTGATFGIANTLPITAAVPDVASITSMMAGLGLIGVIAVRRKRSDQGIIKLNC
jgi:hypothetical protein